MIRERPGARTAALAIAWLEAQRRAHPSQPYFLWVHFFDVHEPREPSPIYAVLAPSRYDAEITGVDRARRRAARRRHRIASGRPNLGRAYRRSRREPGEHGESTHGIFVYESTLHIPLLLRWPGHLPAGRVYEGPVHQVDLYPTILAAAGSKAPANQGVDLLAALSGQSDAPQRPQYSESMLSELGFGMAPLHALRDGDYTYVRAPRPELYDRSSDPGELHDVIEAQPDVAKKLSDALDALIHDSEARGFHAPAHPIDQQTEEALRALGYVGDATTRKEVAALDPKDGIRIYEGLHHARQLVRIGRYADAGDALKKLLAQNPRNVSALNVLALSEARLQHDAEAERIYTKSLAVDANQPRVQLALASMSLQRNQLDVAASRARAALDSSPGFVEALVMLGFIELQRGNKSEADAYYARALRADPKFPRALHAYADMYFRQKDYAHALEYYRKALERFPKNFEALIQAGVSARRTGDMQGALSTYQRAAELRPDSWVPPYNAACLYAVQGDRTRALEQLRRAVANTLSDPDLLMHDPDFAALRKDPEFIALVSQAQANWHTTPESEAPNQPTLVQ